MTKRTFVRYISAREAAERDLGRKFTPAEASRFKLDYLDALLANL